jgi:hypothetical protein
VEYEERKKGRDYGPETPKPRRLSARGFALTAWTADSAAICLAPRVGLEPTTNRLTAGYSTIELPGNPGCPTQPAARGRRCIIVSAARRVALQSKPKSKIRVGQTQEYSRRGRQRQVSGRCGFWTVRAVQAAKGARGVGEFAAWRGERMLRDGGGIPGLSPEARGAGFGCSGAPSTAPIAVDASGGSAMLVDGACGRAGRPPRDGARGRS